MSSSLLGWRGYGSTVLGTASGEGLGTSKRWDHNGNTSYKNYVDIIFIA